MGSRPLPERALRCALAALPALVALQARSWLSRTPPGRLLADRRAAPRRFADQWVNRVARA